MYMAKPPPFGPEAETDSSNPVLEQLRKIKEAKTGVRKDNENKVSPTLTSPEVARYKKIFGILKEVIDPGPEARKIAASKESKIPNVSQIQGAKTPGAKSFNWKALLGVIGASLIASIVAMVDEVGAFLIKTALKIQRIIKPVLKFFNATRKLLTRGFGKALKHIKPLMTIITKVGDWFGNIFRGLKASKGLSSLLSGGKNVWATIKGAAAKIGTKLLKFGRFIPVVGSLFSFGFAIKRFVSGDYLGGGLELMSGILNLLPGVGWMASMAIDGYLLWRDWDKEKQEDTGTEELKGPGKLSQIWTGIKGWFAENATKLPIISGIMQLGKAAKLLGDKKWVEGIKALGMVMPYFMVGEAGVDAIGYGANFLMDLFEAKPEDQSKNMDEGANFGEIMSVLYDTVGDVLSKLWSGITGFIAEWVNRVATNVKETAINGVRAFAATAGNLIGWDAGSFIDDIFADLSVKPTSGDSGEQSKKVYKGSSDADVAVMIGLDQKRNNILESMQSDLRQIREVLLTPTTTWDSGFGPDLEQQYFDMYPGRGRMGPSR